jgi:hypothetical protein
LCFNFWPESNRLESRNHFHSSTFTEFLFTAVNISRYSLLQRDVLGNVKNGLGLSPTLMVSKTVNVQPGSVVITSETKYTPEIV